MVGRWINEPQIFVLLLDLTIAVSYGRAEDILVVSFVQMSISSKNVRAVDRLDIKLRFPLIWPWKPPKERWWSVQVAFKAISEEASIDCSIDCSAIFEARLVLLSLRLDHTKTLTRSTQVELLLKYCLKYCFNGENYAFRTVTEFSIYSACAHDAQLYAETNEQS